MTDPRQVEALKTSEARFGQIHPVIESADGDLISGNHRVKADPTWRREKRDDIKEPFDKIAFRLAANVQRLMPPREKSELIRAAYGHYSRTHPQPTMKQFAHDVGVPASWISTYCSDLFRQRPDGLLTIPPGTVLSSPRLPRETREETLNKVREIRLKIYHAGTSHYVHLPRVLTMKYDLHGGDELTVTYEQDQFTVRKAAKGSAVE